jgi:hypothetical protein
MERTRGDGAVRMLSSQQLGGGKSMRKPISKHGLRRALERVQAEGHIEYREPVGTVVDKIWHELERKNYSSGRKKPVGRDSVRTAAPEELDTTV